MTIPSSLYGAHHCKRPGIANAIRQELAAAQPPQPYPEMTLLPFMRRASGDEFQFAEAPYHPKGPARMVLLQGANLVVTNQDTDEITLPYGEQPDWAVCPDMLGFSYYKGEAVIAGTLAKGTAIPAPYRLEPFNAFQETLSPATMSVAGLGKQVLAWTASCQVCSRCGGEPLFSQRNWGRTCQSCGHEHFPSIHPCAIVLIKRGDDLLLIRKPEWPENRFSLVAGFLDMGESFEECAAREAREETGVTIRNIRYVTSQPWPFPSQVMIGFTAEYAGGDLSIPPDEIAEARWFRPDELPDLPSKRSIARFLIDNYGH